MSGSFSSIHNFLVNKGLTFEQTVKIHNENLGEDSTSRPDDGFYLSYQTVNRKARYVVYARQQLSDDTRRLFVIVRPDQAYRKNNTMPYSTLRNAYYKVQPHEANARWDEIYKKFHNQMELSVLCGREPAHLGIGRRRAYGFLKCYLFIFICLLVSLFSPSNYLWN